ncbi:MAG: hypothetical protein E4G96_10680, partial [Chrysiogenales bacterium]
MSRVAGGAVLALLVHLALASCGHNDAAIQGLKATGGILDLGGWDFDMKGTVELSGEWEFYWGRLLHSKFPHVEPAAEFINVPGIWNGHVIDGKKLPGEGRSTYRLFLRMPKQFQSGGGERLALMVHGIGTAYSIFINGSPVGGGGRVGESRDSSIPGYRPAIYAFMPGGRQVEILIHVSNYHHRKGGVWEKITLGPEPMIREGRDRRMARNFFLFGSIFLMGAYHLLLFALRKKDRSYCFFGILCFLIAVRILVTGEYYALHLVPWLPWKTVIGAEYISFYAAVPFFFLFMHSLFPDEFGDKPLVVVVIYGAIFSLIVIVSHPRFYTHTIQAYQIATTLFCVYGFIVLARARARKREGAYPFTAGFIILFTAVINDFLRNNMLLQTGYLVPLGLFAFIISQAFLLSIRFSKTIGAVEDLTAELERKNMRLLDLDRMKDDFLAAVSHELRTPLNGIIGLTESMRAGRRGEWSDDEISVLEMIHSSGRRLSDLVNDLLDFSRLKYRDASINLEPVDLRVIVDLVIGLTRPLVGTKPLQLINEIEPGGPMVFADEKRLQQVLHN